MAIPPDFNEFKGCTLCPIDVKVADLQGASSIDDDTFVMVTTDAWPVGLIRLSGLTNEDRDLQIGDVEIAPALPLEIPDEGLDDDILSSMITTLSRRRAPGFVALKQGQVVGVLTADAIVKAMSARSFGEARTCLVNFVVYQCGNGHTQYFTVEPPVPPQCDQDNQLMYRV